MTAATALERLCSLAGIEVEFATTDGRVTRVAPETQRAVLAAMDFAVDDEAAVLRACQELEDRRWLRPLEPVSVQSAVKAACSVEIAVPRPHEHGFMAWLLEMENGERREGRFCPAELPVVAERVIGERRYRRYAFTLPEVPPPGYHRLSIGSAESGWCAALCLIMTPAQGYLPPVLQGDARVWGLELQLYAVRSRRNWGMGDFTDLSTVVDFAAERGADLVAINPLHALWPDDPARCDPYLPSSRLTCSLLYLDVEAIADYDDCETARSTVADPGFQAHLRALRGEEQVNHEAVTAAKRGLLEQLFAHFRESHRQRDTPRAKAFAAFKARLGEALRRRTLFDALAEHFARQGLAVWPAWPVEFQSPDSAQVQAFAEAHPERLDFFAYLYWQADLQFESCGRRSFEWRLGIGLCEALSLTPAADGAEAWAEPTLYARSSRSGSPPDKFHPDGQSGGASPTIPWRLREAAYGPLVAALRENMRHTGAVMLHPAGCLQRQYWIPAGASAKDGAWVAMPTEDILGIVALESQRNRCMVLVADDMPLAEASLDERLASRALFRCRSLFGELARSTLPLEDRRPFSTLLRAMPDEPTLRGFWLGWDLDALSALELFASEDVRAEQIAMRGLECAKLLAVLDREGLLPEGVSVHPTSVPDMTPELARAVYYRLGRSPTRMVLLRAEDMLGQIEQPCLPGIPVAYPNWRNRLPLDLEEWRKEAKIDALVAALNEVRGASLRSQPPCEKTLSRVCFSIPQSTYRLQFNRDFTFGQASELLPYLKELGISHCYASPYLKARPGSSHGYDIIDHGEINPEIGSREEFEGFCRELERLGMGQILDMVPNHMGVMGSDNAWWLDVLENGQASDYAGFFDIEWSPLKDSLRGKVLLPVLGSPYGTVLEEGELKLAFDPASGAFSVHYGPHGFPVDPREYPLILRHRLDQLGAAMGEAHPQLLELQTLITALGHLPGRTAVAEERRAERQRDKKVYKQHLVELCRSSQDIAQFIARNVAEFNGTAGVPASFKRLHDLLERQAYRLACWRVAADEINYRRFFDINDLAALRTEDEDVFDRIHRLVLELIASGKVHGLRIDHPDGLYDPQAYFERLQARILALAGKPADDAGGAGHRFYLLVEKILAAGEELPPSWPVHGTTGYDFANQLGGLFVWAAAKEALETLWASFAADGTDFDAQLQQCKRLILKVALSSELAVLANQLSRIAESDHRTRDYSLNSLREALREIITCLPVYRTYVSARGVSGTDAAYIDRAVEAAKRVSHADDISVFDFVRDVLLTRQAEGKSEAYARAVLAFAMKFQQLTGPVMAKGLEDTAFYRYHRLIALNEVGGDPRRFGMTLADFHRANRQRAKRWPHSLLTTSTHDSKRSEDVRARLNVLSELADEWSSRVLGWRELNRERKRRVNGRPAPADCDEYLIYQILAGSWPLQPMRAEDRANYQGRLEQCLLKAMREAKLYSSWLNPNSDYEEASLAFLRSLIDEPAPARFLAEFLPFQAKVARFGMFNSLSQLLLKLAVPGVPDIYQGNEVWDFSLVDSDNRRPVDYSRRRTLLEELRAWDALAAKALAPRLQDMLGNMEDGRIKLYVTRQALRLRQTYPDVFLHGGYQPVLAEGEKTEHLCSFVRRHERRTVWVLVPRCAARLLEGHGKSPGDPAVWGKTRIAWPAAMGSFKNVLSGECISPGEGRALPVASFFRRCPVALLVNQD